MLQRFVATSQLLIWHELPVEGQLIACPQPLQTPNSLHTFPSPQDVPSTTGVWTQAPLLQLSVVQALPSAQIFPAQASTGPAGAQVRLVQMPEQHCLAL